MHKHNISTLHTVVCLVACTPLSALLQLSACRIAGLLWNPSLLSSLLFSIKMEDSDVRSLRASLRAMKKEKEELERRYEEELERRYEEEQESQERRERKLLDALSSAGISEFEIGQMHTYTYRGSRHICSILVKPCSCSDT